LTKRAPEPVAVLKTYREIHRGNRPVLDEEQSLVKSHLKLSGVVRREGRRLHVRNRIYHQVFDWQWIKAHFPENLWQRIKPALPLILILLIGLISMSVLAGMVISANNKLERQIQITDLREKTSLVLSWTSTAKAVDGLVLAIQATGQSRDQNLSTLSGTVDSSLQSAVELVKEQNRLQGHTNAVYSVAFSPNGQRVVSGSRDNTLRLWDVNGTPIGQPFQGHTDAVLSVAFSPDGQRIVSGSWDNILRLWDVNGTAIGQPFQGHTDAVLLVAFSPDGQHIVSGSQDKTLRLWDINGTAIGQPFQGHTDGVWSVAFSLDGQRIVSGSEDKTLRLWDVNGTPIGQPLRGHTDAVISVAFSPDGQHIVSWEGDIGDES
jgi:WD40 repeat protein